MIALKRKILSYMGTLEKERREHFYRYFLDIICPEWERNNEHMEQLYIENIMLKKKYEGYDEAD